MKRRMSVIVVAAALGIAGPTVCFAQAASPSIASSDVLSQISMYSYRDGPKSSLYFRGTPVAALAEGKARVEYQDGNAEISAEVEKLPPPASLGPYAVYVLWAVTPDGRAVNQGIIAGADGGKGNVETEYGASQFALIVTAEPHFAVTVPSTMIALYNVGDNVKGNESKVTTLTERSDYSNLPRPPFVDNGDTELVQARYSVAIARAAGAEQFAPAAYASANGKLAAAEAATDAKRRAERKTAPLLAREAVVAGEDARRAAMIASAAAQAEAQRVASADAATRVANVAAGQAAEAASAAARAAAEVEAQRSAAAAMAAARSDLRDRLNGALPTRDTSRGLVSEVGTLQFATGAAEINPTARESVAKLSGIVASYPGLRFNVEGHTDSTGSMATNNELSLRRAITIRDYLIAQGVLASSIEVAGLGSSMPMGDNATADGRARNRRVDIVISGGPLAAQ
jgi:outer membrane protein OmpA-like peptidoglycan-associated protein